MARLNIQKIHSGLRVLFSSVLNIVGRCSRSLKILISFGVLLGACAFLALAGRESTSTPLGQAAFGSPSLFADFTPETTALFSGGLIVAGLLTIILLQSRTQRRLQDAVRQADEQARQCRYTVDNIPAFLLAFDQHGALLFWNAACSQSTGYAPDRILGHDGIWNLFFPEPSMRNAEMQLRMKPTPSYNDHVSTITCADGTQKTISWTNHSAQSPIPGWHSWEIGTDITATTQAMLALKKRESRQTELLNSLPDAVWLKDSALRFLAMNKAFMDLTTRKESDLLGKTAREAGLPAQLLLFDEERRALWLNTPEHAESSFNGRRFEITFIPRVAPSGDKTGIAGIIHDATDAHAAHIALETLKNTAEIANKTKSEFLADMSHEIRTPLNGILGMLQLMQSTPLNREQELFIRTAINTSQLLSRLLADILDLSRIEAERLTILREPFSLDDLRLAVLEMYQFTADQNGVRLCIETEPNVPAQLIGDGARVRQIIFNLVGNALKFTARGEVNVHTRLLQKQQEHCILLFTVSDTGSGIPDQLLTSIFEPFTQLQAASRRHGGVGLGLTIVKRLIHMMNGTLSISAEPGDGTEICFTLPFGITTSALTKPVANKEQISRKLHILVAEDDSVNQLAISRMLEKHGHHAVCVGNGLQLLDLIKKMPVDLVLMDVQMPEMDGLEATKHIRLLREFAAVKEIPIIALTACAMSGDRERFLSAGMNDYVPKPIDWRSLNAAILRVLGSKAYS